MHIWSFVYSVSAWKTHSLPQIQWIVLYTLENILLKERNIKKKIEICYDVLFAIGNFKMVYS